MSNSPTAPNERCPFARCHDFLPWWDVETGAYGISCRECHKTWVSWSGDLIPTWMLNAADMPLTH